MKICIILTGHTRTFAHCKDSIINKFLNSETDIYCCTWNNEGNYSLQERFNLPVKKQLILDSSYKIDNLIPIDRENDIFKKSPRAKYNLELGWVKRLKYQWYCVKKAFEMIEEYEKYDLIIRCRYDVKFNDKNIIKYDFKKLNVPMIHSTEHILEINNTDQFGTIESYSDHFAIGNPEIMKKYFSLYDHITEMYEKYNVDISYAEQMLSFYIKNICKIATNFCDIDYRIIKNSGDSKRL